jgi:dTDP-4-dehydrorhamnose 3,5-epimerase
MWDDATIGIDWASVAPDVKPLLSDKDTKHPEFSFENNYFDINGVWIE